MRTGETRTGWRRIEENTIAKTGVATDWDSKRLGRHKVPLGVSASRAHFANYLNRGPHAHGLHQHSCQSDAQQWQTLTARRLGEDIHDLLAILDAATRANAVSLVSTGYQRV